MSDDRAAQTNPRSTGHARLEKLERTCPMGLLPCLRRGSERWWLPCSGQAAESIAKILLAYGRSDPLDRAARSQVQQALLTDPPLLIYATLSWPGDHVDSLELVDWLAEHAASRFATADAYLGAPTITPGLRQRWRKLRDHFRTRPVECWLEEASLWLEAAGPKVSAAWQQQWPSVTVSGNGADIAEPTTNASLQQLARMMQRQRSLEASFDQQLHKSKLGALKQLAYGLSHEINNPLANISTRAQQLQRGESDPGRSATLQRIVDQVYRAHEMIADLMFYANPPPQQASECDLKRILDSVVHSFRDEADRQVIRLEVSQPEPPVTIVADEQMVGEAIRVLIRNAIEAIGCQGTIVASIADERDRVIVHIADSGPGLSEQAREHAFDPYFSGREAGRGLGLGLCRAYRIAKLHHGDITLAGGPAGCVASITWYR